MFILDTNTISYYFRGVSNIVRNMQAISPQDIGVPAIVEYELRYGLLRLPQEAATPRLIALEKLLRPMTSLPFDEQCASQAAQIRANLEAEGQPIGPHDVLIAATALNYKGTLVTRNIREFNRINSLKIMDWFE